VRGMIDYFTEGVVIFLVGWGCFRSKTAPWLYRRSGCFGGLLGPECSLRGALIRIDVE
jgi:hypothetical protein